MSGTHGRKLRLQFEYRPCAHSVLLTAHIVRPDGGWDRAVIGLTRLFSISSFLEKTLGQLGQRDKRDTGHDELTVGGVQ